MTDKATFAISYLLRGEPMTHLSHAEQLSLEDAAAELFELHGFVVPEHPLGGRSAIIEQLPTTGISDIQLQEL
ncbi:hypothetical protein [Pseudomonas sp. RIT-PI-AD]|uniref:hypothetical protein n=1 Tax=Pseudomonas sp. RIT-PI-AD TaxID=3035294 RepID=UPI0021D94A97|nr:hypothetical protein [Pseudomonas sp. RIT-PI-AD]